MKPTVNPPTRIMAIDALRGFDMFWLTGGMAMLLAVARAIWSPLPAWITYHTRHVAWEGFSAWDLVMPLFLFVVGTALPFSVGRRREGSPAGAVWFRIIKRALILFLLGMAVQGNLLSFDPGRIKIFCNTLQAIACGYVIASACLLHLTWKQQLTTALGMLLIYWAAMTWIPFGGHEAGTLTPSVNLAIFIDHAVLGRFQDGTAYAWILPILSFGALTILGSLAGQILRDGASKTANCLMLAAAGAACLGGGWLWSLDFPMIKHLFTSSMVLWAAGWSFLLLAAFYLLTDICGFERLVVPFKVLGSNAIFVYMWTSMCPPSRNVSRVLFEGFSSCFGSWGDAVFLTLDYALIFTVMYYLYRNRTFIKV